MSTVTVARKNGYVAIAADTQVSRGSVKVTAIYNRSFSKMVRWGHSLIGFTGYIATQQAIDHAIRTAAGEPTLASPVEIFEVFRVIHARLKSESFLNAGTDPREEPFESSHMNLLIANPHGIFGVGEIRTVIEYERFWAAGSGCEFALGAMHALYDGSNDVAAIARAGVQAAVAFDSATGAPIESHVMAMAPSEVAQLQAMYEL